MTSFPWYALPLLWVLFLLACSPVLPKILHDGVYYDEVYTDGLDEAWYNSDKLPEVDLVGLVEKLSAQISWFKYVGNTTLRCSDRAKEKDTLMMAIEDLHSCLNDQYVECASEYAEEEGCVVPYEATKPCGTFRFGIKTLSSNDVYKHNADCRWFLSVPREFAMNLTIDEFHLEASGPNCPYDYMMIYDGNSTMAPTRYGRYCGSRPVFTIYGTGYIMMITVHTDNTIGKLGFRGVYQVMDSGIGKMLNGTYRVDAGHGTLNLDDYPPSRFDTYIRSYYYTEWHIRADYDQRLLVSIMMELGVGAIADIFDGPKNWNTEIMKVKDTDNFTFPNTTFTTDSWGFQILVVLQQLNMTDNTSFVLNYTTVPQSTKYINRNQSIYCKGSSEIRLTPGKTKDISMAEIAPSSKGKGILCFWNVRAPPGMFVQVHITAYSFAGPNSENCAYDGLLFLNGANFSADVQRVGPMCYTEPRNLFSPVRRGVNNITSSGESMVIHFYSYTRKPFVNVRSFFRAKLSVSHCQGLLQPCSSPQLQTTPYFMSMFNLTTSRYGTELNYKFSCQKTKCCILQQFPVYRPLEVQSCVIQAMTHGETLLATSTFSVNMNVPDKDDTGLEYACQRDWHLASYSAGGHREKCKGTQTHIRYTTTSEWAMAAFNIKVEPSPCGYYRPDLHPENVFYPPCAKAEIPVNFESSTIEYIDYNTSDYTFYDIVFKYKDMTRCNGDPCGNTILKIMGNNTFLGWSKLSPMPFSWKTWGKNTEDNFIKRNLKILREQVPECEEDITLSNACEIEVDFHDDKMKWGTVGISEDYECQDGYELIGEGCYRLLWPGIDPSTGPVSGNYTMSANEAEKACNQNGSHLVSVNTRREHDHLRRHAHYAWWPKYLQYLPGSKVFHIGIMADESRNYRWMNGQSVQFTIWNIPDYNARMPDTGGSTTTEHIVPAIKSASLKASLKYMHPRPDQGGDCAVLVLVNYHIDGRWVKVDCEDKITGSLPICETEPKIVSSEKATEKTEVTSNYTKLWTTIDVTDGKHRLTLPDIECPRSFTMVGEKCFMLLTNPHSPSSTVKLSTPTSSCFDGSTIATVTFADVENIRKIIPSWKHSAEGGSIRVRHLPFNTAEGKHGKNNSYNGFIIEPMITHDGPNDTNPVTDWKLTDIRDNNTNEFLMKQNVYSYLCETPPIPVEDKCGANHFMCSDKTCIIEHMMCDGHEDCLDGLDEANCTEICWFTTGLDPRYTHIKPGRIPKTISKTDSYHQTGKAKPYVYYPGVPPSPAAIEDMWGSDCFRDCPTNNCTCSDLYFQCNSGGCIPASKLCDFFPDCTDGSDEGLCNNIGCEGPEHFQCYNGQCLTSEQKCNFVVDCIDGTDEVGCHLNETCAVSDTIYTTPVPELILDNDKKVYADKVFAKYFQCSPFQNVSACIPGYRENDHYPDCPGPSPSDERSIIRRLSSRRFQSDGSLKLPEAYWCPERPDYVTCHASFPDRCLPRSATCYFEKDQLGAVKGCRDGAHIANCEHRQCGTDFKCPNSYCLPLRQVCDGITDCLHGEDEQKCSNLFCPGMFQCRGGTKCIRQSQVCDGHVDCPLYQDDETLCGHRKHGCPLDCECLGRAIDCSSRNISSADFLNGVDKEARVLILRDNNIDNLPESMLQFTRLYKLDLSYNKLPTFNEQRFQFMHMLIHLYMDNNNIGSISRQHFIGMWNLRVLTFHNNDISILTRSVFDGLNTLTNMDLSGQELRTLEEYYFAGLKSVQVINLTYNTMEEIENRSFCDLDHRERPIPLRNIRYIDLRHNNIKTAEPDAFKFLPPETTMYADRFKFCCFARHIKECHPPPDEFSSCDDLIANKGLRVSVWAIALLSVIGNVVVLRQRMKHERETTSSILVQHLSFSDLIMGLYCLIILSADEHMRGHYIFDADTWRTHALCKLSAFLSMLSCEMSTFILMLMTLDRVFAVISCCRSRGISLKAARGLIALGWTVTAIVGVIPILEFGYFGNPGLVRSGVCTLFNTIKGRIHGWEFSMGVFICFNFAASLIMALGYSFAWKSYMRGVDNWPLPEDLTEEEREAEITFRKNEMIITRRLVLLVITNCLIWMPLVGVGAFALFEYYVDKVTSAWITLFFMPLNAALNPFLYTLNTRPYRILADDLLANWVQAEADKEDDDEDGDEKNETGIGESSVGGTTLATKSEAISTSKTREGVLKDIL